MIKVSFFDLNVGWGGAEIFFRSACETMQGLVNARYSRWTPWKGFSEALLQRTSDVVVINVSLLGVGFHRLIPFLLIRKKCLLYIHLANDHMVIGSRLPLIRNFLGKISVRLFPNVIAISRGNEKLLCALGCCVHYLPNFISAANNSPSEMRIDPNFIAIVGRLCEKQKRQMEFIETNSDWIRSKNLKIAIYGSGPDEFALRSLVERLKLQANVVFKGWVPTDKIWESDVGVVVSSSAFEAMPLNILEAVFHDRLVIATKVAGAEELLESEFLFESIADFPRLYKALASMPLGPLLARQKQRLSEEHNVQTYRSRFVTILERLAR